MVVRGLKKHYGEIRAVDGVDLRIERGEFFGMLGPNGAGKTTLLEMMEGLRQPDSGDVALLGESPWPRNPALLPRIGVQLQATSFFERLTAREQLTTFADVYGVGRARVDEMLEHVGLLEHASVRTDKLSGGQMQRLSIACALVHDPEIVFLDEPTAALDPAARRNLWDLLGSLNDQGRTVVLTTHSMEEAATLCDRVAIIDHGRILAVDRPSALVHSLDAPTRLVLPDHVLDAKRAAQLPGVRDVRVDAGSVTLTCDEPAVTLRALADADLLDGLSVHGATLEDVFLDLTGREYRV